MRTTLATKANAAKRSRAVIAALVLGLGGALWFVVAELRDPPREAPRAVGQNDAPPVEQRAAAASPGAARAAPPQTRPPVRAPWESRRENAPPLEAGYVPAWQLAPAPPESRPLPEPAPSDPQRDATPLHRAGEALRPVHPAITLGPP